MSRFNFSFHPSLDNDDSDILSFSSSSPTASETSDSCIYITDARKFSIRRKSDGIQEQAMFATPVLFVQTDREGKLTCDLELHLTGTPGLSKEDREDWKSLMKAAMKPEADEWTRKCTDTLAYDSSSYDTTTDAAGFWGAHARLILLQDTFLDRPDVEVREEETELSTLGDLLQKEHGGYPKVVAFSLQDPLVEHDILLNTDRGKRSFKVSMNPMFVKATLQSGGVRLGHYSAHYFHNDAHLPSNHEYQLSQQMGSIRAKWREPGKPLLFNNLKGIHNELELLKTSAEESQLAYYNEQATTLRVAMEEASKPAQSGDPDGSSA